MEQPCFLNRRELKIVTNVYVQDPSKGLVFIMHGLGGYKEQPHLTAFAEVFLDHGYTVVKFDTTNSFGESGGFYENASVTSYREDLEDVINWAKGEDWYKEPYILVGHSLGGISSILHAQKYPNEIAALAPISTVVSGKTYKETYTHEQLENWEKTGWFSKPSKSKPGRIKNLKWSFIKDIEKYDVIPEIEKISMPVLLIVGDKDTTTFPRHQRILFDSIRGSRKEFHLIEGAPHSFVDNAHLDEIRQIFDRWIRKV